MVGSGRAASSRSIRHVIDDVRESPRTSFQAARATRGSSATPQPSSKASRSRDRRGARLNARSALLDRSATTDSSSHRFLFEFHLRLPFRRGRSLEAWIMPLSVYSFERPDPTTGARISQDRCAILLNLFRRAKTTATFVEPAQTSASVFPFLFCPLLQ